MKRTRINPPNPPYKAYASRANGTRQPLDAHGIIVELRPGIEIDFAPHPDFAGMLIMLTPPCPRMKQLYDEGKIDDFAVVFGGTNVLHVLVERRIRSPKHSDSAMRPRRAAKKEVAKKGA